MNRWWVPSRSRVSLLVEIAVPVVLYGVLAWGYGGPADVGWREARHLEVGVRGSTEADREVSVSSPVYHALLRRWLDVRQDGSWGRRFSFVMGLCAVAAVWAAGRTLFGAAEGVTFALLFVLNPLTYRYTHAVSPHACFWALAAASVALWYSMLNRGGPVRWGLYTLAAAGTLYAGWLGFAVVGTQVAMAVWRVAVPSRRERPVRRPILEVAAASIVLVGLAVPRVLQHASSPGPRMPSGAKVTGVTLDLLDGAYRDLAGGGGFAAISLGVLALAGLIASVRKRVVRSRGIGRVYVDKRRRRPAVCVFWTLVTGILTASLLTVPFTRSLRPEHLHGLLPFFLLLSARGIVEIASIVRRVTRSLLGITAPRTVFAGVLSVALVVLSFLDNVRRQQVEGATSRGWRHAGERLAACVRLGGKLLVLPAEAAPAVRWNTPALRDAQFPAATPSDIGPGTICLIATVDDVPPVPETLQSVSGERLQEVDRYLFPNRKGFFSLRASTGVASVARRLLAARDLLGDDPMSPRALRDFADACADGGALDDARGALQQLLATEQASAEDLVFLGLLEEHAGLEKEAVGRYQNALNSNSDLALAQTRIGRILAARGELAAARTRLERALAILPTDVEALASLADILATQGQETALVGVQTELDRLRPAVRIDRAFGARIAVLGYTPGDTAVAQGEPLELSHHLRCLRPIPPGHQVRHRIVGAGVRVSYQSVEFEDSASVAGCRPGETMVVDCSVGAEWTASGGTGQLQLGLAGPDGALLPVAGLGDAWLPIASLRVNVGEVEEPVASVPAQDLEKSTGFMMTDGLSVSPAGAWTEFVLGPGRWRVVVEARGMPAGGDWPIMSIEVDGSPNCQATVATSSWHGYSCPVGEGPGRVRVNVKFLNDYYDAVTGEDRNVVVSAINLVQETRLLVLEPAA